MEARRGEMGRNLFVMNDEFNRQQLADLVKARGYRSDFMRMCADHAAAGKPFFESVFGPPCS